MPLTIHFLNVGHGDCTVIEHPSGRITVVDMNNGDSIDQKSLLEIAQEFGLYAPFSYPLAFSASALLLRLRAQGYEEREENPIEFLLSRYPGRPIFRYVQSHPDLDHMRGLANLVTTGILIINMWDTSHMKKPDLRPADGMDWLHYNQLRAGRFCKVMRLHRGDLGPYWAQDGYGGPGDGIEILAPTPQLCASASSGQCWNRLSYVLRLRHANRSVILGGDADEDVWQDIVRIYGLGLKCDVLKASHHGRDSGYHRLAVALMRPTVTICSVGRKPECDASNKYRPFSAQVVSTRWEGTITLRIDDLGNMQWMTNRHLRQVLTPLISSA